MSPAELLWRAECRFNRRLPWRAADRSRGRFIAQGASTDVLSGVLPHLSAALELVVVVTTYGRPGACREQLVALHEALAAAGCEEHAFVLVFVDTSDTDYAPVLAELVRMFESRFALYESTGRIGKQDFWCTYQSAFDAVQVLGAPFALFLQDDLTFERSLVRDVLERWKAIEDDGKAVLYLCTMPDDEPGGRWIQHSRQELPSADVRRTQWFDLQAFLAHRSFFERLGFEVFPVPARRWSKDPSRSSGVGEQFTRRLFGRANIYQVSETLVYHGALPSLMNPEARRERPLDNRPGSSSSRRA